MFPASSSSCTSSVANLGSPKPEKRQANSPLPPPPAVSPDLLHANGDEKNSSTVVRNLEDMYAKVHKNKRKSEDQASSSSEIPSGKSSKKRWSRDSFEDFKHLDASEIDAHHCYETLNKGDKKCTPNTNDNSGPESLLSNDPGYEQLSPQNRAPSESDPNYEVLRPQRTNSIAGYSTIGKKKDKAVLTVPLTEDGYSVVNKISKKLRVVVNSEPGYEEILNKIIDEPNYESMPSEDNYATINNNKSTDNESDPNYESVKYLDVHLAKGEPPYERLQDDENAVVKSSDCSANSNKTVLSDYERIKNSASSKDSDNNSEDISGNTPEYDRIKSSENSDSSRLSSTPEYERLKEGSSNNSVELDYKLHNGEVLVVEQVSIILNEVTEVKINIPEVQKDAVDAEGDIFHV